MWIELLSPAFIAELLCAIKEKYRAQKLGKVPSTDQHREDE